MFPAYLESYFQVTRSVEVRCGPNNQDVVFQCACAMTIFGDTPQILLRDTRSLQIILGPLVSNEITGVQLEITKRNYRDQLCVVGVGKTWIGMFNLNAKNTIGKNGAN